MFEIDRILLSHAKNYALLNRSTSIRDKAIIKDMNIDQERYDKSLKRLVKEGYVEEMGWVNNQMRYRITRSGKAYGKNMDKKKLPKNLHEALAHTNDDKKAVLLAFLTGYIINLIINKI